MMAGLPFSSIVQCKQIRHDGTCLELFQTIGSFELKFSEAHHACNMNCKLRSLKSRIKTHPFLENIITSSNEALKDFEYGIAVRM